MSITIRPVMFVCLLPLLAAACGGTAKEQSGVRTVEATIEGITCESCVPPLTAALKRQFGEDATIDVDDETDTATVRLPENQSFSVAPFLEAAKQVRMRVMSFRLEVCGRLEAQESQRWLIAGTNRFLVTGNPDLPFNQPLCLEGRLDASREPMTLDVTKGGREQGQKGGATE